MRKLINEKKVSTTEKAVSLEVYTKCPKKWYLFDAETGQLYLGNEDVSKHHWQKIKTPDDLIKEISKYL